MDIISASKRNKALIKVAVQRALVAKGILPERKRVVLTAELEHQICLKELSIREKKLECEHERLQAQTREQESKLALPFGTGSTVSLLPLNRSHST